jgi:hypothetical protein
MGVITKQMLLSWTTDDPRSPVHSRKEKNNNAFSKTLSLTHTHTQQIIKLKV